MNITLLDTDSIGTDLDFSPITLLGNAKIYGSTTPTQLEERLADTEVAVLNKVKMTAEVLKKAPMLKLICVAATGFDNIDLDYCRKNGIAVANVPGYSTHSVAAVTFTLALNLLTHFKEYSSFVCSGEYTDKGAPNKISPAFNDLFGKTWGIVGYGNIGKQVEQVALAFGCNVIYCKNSPDGSTRCVDVDTLCKQSDVISLHCPLNDGTRGLIDGRRISLMKDTVILVNTARGAVCDEYAVAQAVKDGKIAGFGCDVYSTEPFPVSHPLNEIKEYPNVCLTPHMAWASYEARVRVVREMSDNVKAFVCGERRNRVD